MKRNRKISNKLFSETKLERLYIFDKLGLNIFIKRDDLFPYYLGGNKAKKIIYIGEKAIADGYNMLITNGGLQSNHCRATALFCAENNLKCRLVLHTGKKNSNLQGNFLLSYLAGAKIDFTSLSSLSNAMDKAMLEEQKRGNKPLYIWGGGHCLEGSLAYYDAAKEAQKQCGDWIPDYIIHASGTGTTQAGLIAGYSHLPTKIIGISVARNKERGTSVISDSLKELCKYLKLDFSNMKVDFRDDWTCGGYEKTTPELYNCIDEAGKNGLILDPTYTGKAYLAMKDLINSGEIAKGGKILFWHTGGLLNLMSSQHYTNQIIK